MKVHIHIKIKLYKHVEGCFQLICNLYCTVLATSVSVNLLQPDLFFIIFIFWGCGKNRFVEEPKRKRRIEALEEVCKVIGNGCK